VTVQPSGQPAGEFVRANVRVPNERGNASTSKVEVQFPDGFLFASYEPVPGWKGKITFEKLAKPVPSPEGGGETIKEQAKQATFTATGGNDGVGPGQFQDFGLSLLMPKKPGATLTFKTIQTYSDGKVVRWIGPPDSEEPAPQVKLTAAEGEGGGTAPAAQQQSTSGDGGDDGGSDALSIVALIVGAAGLAVGLAALLRGRRKSFTPAQHTSHN
jgi:uncharacterized protein